MSNEFTELSAQAARCQELEAAGPERRTAAARRLLAWCGTGEDPTAEVLSAAALILAAATDGGEVSRLGTEVFRWALAAQLENALIAAPMWAETADFDASGRHHGDVR